MEDYILISWLNDYVFCPYSIYLHNIYNQVDNSVYYTTAQTKGKTAHNSVDNNHYSTHKSDIVGIEVFSDQYHLCGKIDILHSSNNMLVERKRKIVNIYDGYKYQLYAQYFALREMGYKVEQLAFHSLIDNKRYLIDIPSGTELNNFEQTVYNLHHFNPADITININHNKCANCIYRQLCDITDLGDY